MPPAGESFVYTFPFWLYVSVSANLETKELSMSQTPLRIYSPFRSGPANFIPMPYVNPRSIPFLPNARPNFAPDFQPISLAAIPTFNIGLVLTGGDTWGDTPPDPFPMDSLRIDVGETRDGDVIGERALKMLLRILRVRTQQWWIGHSVHGLAGYLRNVFPILERGEPTQLPVGRARGRTVNGDELPIEAALWEVSLRDLEQGVTPPFHRELLLDGRYFGSVGEYRRAVVDLAMACEQAKDIAFERLWTASAPGVPFHRGRLMSGYDLLEHLDRDLRRFGRSFRVEHPDKFDALSELWDARGNCVHQGEAVFRRNGELVAVDENVFKGFGSVATHCVQWLESLGQ